MFIHFILSLTELFTCTRCDLDIIPVIKSFSVSLEDGHSFHKCFLSSCYGPGIEPDEEDGDTNKTDRVPDPVELRL